MNSSSGKREGNVVSWHLAGAENYPQSDNLSYCVQSHEIGVTGGPSCHT